MLYKLHMAYSSREDMARDAIESVQAIGHVHAWPNGEPCPIGDLPRDTEVHYLPPMAPVSIINCMIKSSWNDDVMFWMHNDGYAQPGAAERLLDKAKAFHQSDCRWGVLFTLYDVLCCFNMKAVREIGYWDTMFFQYTADMDYYHRMRKAGWAVLDDFGPGVIHRNGEPDPNSGEGAGNPDSRLSAMRSGSMTVRSDPLFNLRTQWREDSGFDKAYYRRKWGGNPEAETFDHPFQR